MFCVCVCVCVTCYVMQIRILIDHNIEYYNRTDNNVKEVGVFTVYSMKACRRVEM